MDDRNSADYYRAREQRERELADAASDPAIAAIHRDMAERYAQLSKPAPHVVPSRARNGA